MNLEYGDTILDLIKYEIDITERLYKTNYNEFINSLNFESDDIFNEKDLYILTAMHSDLHEFNELESKYRELRLSYCNKPLVNKGAFKNIHNELESFLIKIKPKEAKKSVEDLFKNEEEPISVRDVREISSEENSFKARYSRIIKAIKPLAPAISILALIHIIVNFNTQIIELAIYALLILVLLSVKITVPIIHLLKYGSEFVTENKLLSLFILSLIAIAYKKFPIKNMIYSNLYFKYLKSDTYIPDPEIEALYEATNLEFAVLQKEEKDRKNRERKQLEHSLKLMNQYKAQHLSSYV